jgi:DNA-binding Xre family transcriptional regulator
MKIKGKRFKTVSEFGQSLGLSELDMELIRQKKKLIEKLRKVRLNKRFSQTQLAALVGSKQPAIARMESGQVSEISMDFLLRVALALNVRVTIRRYKDAA